MDALTRTHTLVIVCCFIITVSINSVSSIDCYQCNSHFNEDCGGEGKLLSQKHLLPCDTNATFCRKIDQEIEYSENSMGPDSRIIRECGHDQGNEKPYYFTSGLGGLQYVYGCEDKDGCNAASAIKLTPFVVLAAILTRVVL